MAALKETTMMRTARLLALVVIAALAAANLSCNATVGVGFGVPIGSAWGGPGFGTVGVGVSVPIGH
jgi:predicted small secreted protein